MLCFEYFFPPRVVLGVGGWRVQSLCRLEVSVPTWELLFCLGLVQREAVEIDVARALKVTKKKLNKKDLEPEAWHIRAHVLDFSTRTRKELTLRMRRTVGASSWATRSLCQFMLLNHLRAKKTFGLDVCMNFHVKHGDSSIFLHYVFVLIKQTRKQKRCGCFSNITWTVFSAR